jgi:hypothetical protein
LLLVLGSSVGFGGVAEGVAAAAGKEGPPGRRGELEGVEHVEQLGDDAADGPHVDLRKKRERKEWRKGKNGGGGGRGRDGEVTREAETELFSKMRSEEASDGPRVY